MAAAPGRVVSAAVLVTALRPSALRVCGPTTPSAVRPLRRWKRLTARSVSLPNSPVGRGDAQALLEALDGGTAVAALEHDLIAGRRDGASGAANGAAAQAQQRDEDHRGQPPTGGMRHRLSLARLVSPFRCLRGELTGSRWKVRYAARCAAIRPGGLGGRVGSPASGHRDDRNSAIRLGLLTKAGMEADRPAACGGATCAVPTQDAVSALARRFEQVVNDRDDVHASRPPSDSSPGGPCAGSASVRRTSGSAGSDERQLVLERQRDPVHLPAVSISSGPGPE